MPLFLKVAAFISARLESYPNAEPYVYKHLTALVFAYRLPSSSACLDGNARRNLYPDVPHAREELALSYFNISRGLVIVAAFISFVLSVSLWFAGNELEGIFVGLWVPSILSLGGLVLRREDSR